MSSFKKLFNSLVISVVMIYSLAAVDLSFRITPTMLFPQVDFYTNELGVQAQFDFNLFNFLTIGVEGGFFSETPEGTSNSINFLSGGLGLGAYYYPMSRMYLGAGAGFGFFDFSTSIDGETKHAQDLYFRGYGELGFRINPYITVSGNGGYAIYLVKDSDSINKGPFAGISLKVNHSTGKKSSGGFTAIVEQDDVIYPLFQQVYRQSPVGTIKITNVESAEIRNVKVSFRAGKYTSSAMICEIIPFINKMKTVSVPLYADFSSELLKFSENGKLSGEIVMEYELLGKKKFAVQSVTLSVNNRNSYIWGNNESLAAFVSSDTPEILEYAKYVAGITRNNLYTGMNRNIQFTAAMFEALRSSNISYSHDNSTPYIEYHLNGKSDILQYPLQTMNYMGGDYDDLAILLASCLESVGVETALMPIDDDFILFVATGIKETQVANHFANTDGVFIDNNEVYFPLSMANFDKGFTESRKKGIEAVIACFSENSKEYEFISTHKAWEVYPPAVYTGSGSTLQKPSQVELENATKVAIKDYISLDLEVIVANAKESGDSNKLGMAYVRSGRYADAKVEFNKAAAKGSISAMNNIANVLIIEKDYNGAIAQYKKVLQIDPENKTALNGLKNANEKLTE